MTLLFTPHKIGSLETPNRMVRSATAERMAATYPGHGPGSPRPDGTARKAMSGPKVKPSPKAMPINAMPLGRFSNDVESAI